MNKEQTFFTNPNYSEFIEEFENNWLQYATVEEKMKSYFGNLENANKLFEKWKKNEDIWEMRKQILWHFDNKKNLS